MNSKVNNDIFCLAPWVHSHINMSGNRSLCCMAKEWDKKDFPIELSLDDYWNHPIMKATRLKMLSGCPPPETCAACITKQTTVNKPNENFNQYLHLLDHINEHTDPDGFYNHKPLYYDYRMSNQCNLSCRMCNYEASSQIEHAVVKISTRAKEETYLLNENKELNSKKFKPEILEAIEKGELKKIYWASGEAFLQKDHWEIIDKCLDLDQAFGIELVYQTNLGFSYEKLQNYLSKIHAFKSVELIVSLDGVDSNVEFIRDGLKWNTFLTNYQAALADPQITISQLAITLTIPTLLEIKDFFKFLYEYKNNYTVSICFLEGTSALLSPLALDKAVLEKLLLKAEKEILTFSEKDYFNEFKLAFELLRSSTQTMKNSDLNKYAYQNDKLDKQFKRKSLLDYYEQHNLLKGWLKPDPIESNIWAQYHLKYKPECADQNYFPVTHNYHNIKDLHRFFSSFERKETEYIGLLGCCDTLIGKFQSEKKSSAAFLMHENLIRNKEEFEKKFKHLVIFKQYYLPPFKFLLRNLPFKNLAYLLDFLSAPFRPLIAIHSYVLIKIIRN